MKHRPSLIEENKSSMCLSPQEKLKSAAGPRAKRSYSGSALSSELEAKKARLDDRLKSDLELNLDGWISDDYLRAMDFDDRLSQDLDWVAHDEMDLALSMDALVQDHAANDDVNDFGFGPSLLRGGLAFEDPAEMTSTFVDPIYACSEPDTTKDAETLLMSFDTMKFKIPSPTSKASKRWTSIFSANQKQAASMQTTKSASSASVSTPEELRKEQPDVSVANNSASMACPLSVLDFKAPLTLSKLTEKKIGSYSPEARKLRLQKFHEKRKSRTWKKSIKYDCRKKLADDRPRIKGRFVRVHENANAETGVASCSATLVDSMAGYASPKSPTNTMVPPAMVPAVKPQVPRVAMSGLTPGITQTPAVAKPTSSSATTLSFARMIASV